MNNSQTALSKMAGGALAAIVGCALTYAGYQSASSRPEGGSYTVFTGLIFGGVCGFLRGLMELMGFDPDAAIAAPAGRSPSSRKVPVGFGTVAVKNDAQAMVKLGLAWATGLGIALVVIGVIQVGLTRYATASEYARVKGGTDIPAAGAFVKHHAGTSQAAELEEMIWKRVSASTEPGDAKSYLAAFPNGTYRPQAEARVQELTTGQEDTRLAALKAHPTPKDAAQFEKDFPGSTHVAEVRALLIDTLIATKAGNDRSPPPEMLRALLLDAPGGKVSIRCDAFGSDPSASAQRLPWKDAVMGQLNKELAGFGLSLQESWDKPLLRVSGTVKLAHWQHFVRQNKDGTSSATAPSEPGLEVSLTLWVHPGGKSPAAWKTSLSVNTPSYVTNIVEDTNRELRKALEPVFHYVY